MMFLLYILIGLYVYVKKIEQLLDQFNAKIRAFYYGKNQVEMDKKEIARQAKFVNEMAKGRKSVVKGKVIGGGIINQEFSMLEDIDKAISESESAIGELENELAEEK